MNADGYGCILFTSIPQQVFEIKKIQKHALKGGKRHFHPNTLNKFPLSDLSISLGGDYFQFQHNFSQHSPILN